jgi:Flp pilus assembly pilin Flp
MIAQLIRDDRGQDLIEYLALGSFVALAALAGASMLGRGINNWLNNVANWAGSQAAGS